MQGSCEFVDGVVMLLATLVVVVNEHEDSSHASPLFSYHFINIFSHHGQSKRAKRQNSRLADHPDETYASEPSK